MAKHPGALDIRRILEGMARRGKLNPHDVVREAEDPAHPLHNQFEWDDSIAAAKFRLAQAEQLIKRVKLKVRYETARFVIPLYVKSETNSPEYKSLSHAEFERGDAEATMATELARLRGNIERSRGVVAALDAKHPHWGLLESFEDELAIIARRPRASGPAAHAGAGVSAAPLPRI